MLEMLNPPAFTLASASTLLGELDSCDVEQLGRVRGDLEDLALEGGLAPAAQALVAGAARHIREALQSNGAGRSPGLAAARALLEQACRVTGGAPAEPAPAPAPAPRPLVALVTDPSPIEGTDAWLVADFIAESREHMEGAEAALLELETHPEDEEAVNTVFRAFHTIKGTSAFLGLEPITELAHHAESLFTRFRESELSCTGPRADLSLRAVDMLSALLAAVETSRRDGHPFVLPVGYDELLRTLQDPDAGLLEVARFVGPQPLAAPSDAGADAPISSTSSSPASGSARVRTSSA